MIEILKFFISGTLRAMLSQFYIIVVPTGKYVINLSGFMQFLVYLSVMINWVNHRVNDSFNLANTLIIGNR